MIRVLNPYFVSTSLTCKAMAFLEVFTISKKPTIMWQGSHLSFKKCMIITKVSTLTFDIQRSNDIVQEWHDLKVDNINLPLMCSTTLSKISFTKAHLNGKTRQGFYLITNLLSIRASTNDKSTNSLAMNKAKYSSNYFWLGSSLL
jgi:hypothetical protein